MQMVTGATLLLGLSLLIIGNAVATPLLHHQSQDVKRSIPSEGSLDEEVRQLLDLKGIAAQHDLGHLKDQLSTAQAEGAKEDKTKTDGSMEIVKSSSHALKIENGVKDELSRTDEKVMAGGQLVRHAGADVTTHQNPGEPSKTLSKVHLDVPSEGVHETMVDEDGHRMFLHHPEKKAGVGSGRYSPLDLALYVYKTGDEEGVSLAIQELIAEGMMTTDEALTYLHQIRQNLQYLNQQLDHDEKEEVIDLKSLVKKGLPLSLTEMNVRDPEELLAPDLSPDLDYETIMAEKLRGQDYADITFSLQEIIYQLAKILFKQASHREGEAGSERALQDLAALLDREAERGLITPEVEKKVLDVLVTSLVDSLTEKRFPAPPGPMIGGSSFKMANDSPFSLGRQAMIGESDFKPTNDILNLSKSTTKREAEESAKKNEEKTSSN